jgi:KUP system potassium uptake protein
VAVYAVMYVWHRGVLAIRDQVNENPLPVAEFLAGLARDRVVRVPGTAVFLTRVRSGTPAVLRWYVRHSHALQEHVIALTLEIASVPRVRREERLEVTQLAADFWAANACYGFMESPNIPEVMRELALRGCSVDPSRLTYFVGSERIVPRTHGRGLPRWMAAAFGAMLRNSMHLPDYLNVPREQLIDLGRQISI